MWRRTRSAPGRSPDTWTAAGKAEYALPTYCNNALVWPKDARAATRRAAGRPFTSWISGKRQLRTSILLRLIFTFLNSLRPSSPFTVPTIRVLCRRRRLRLRTRHTPSRIWPNSTGSVFLRLASTTGSNPEAKPERAGARRLLPRARPVAAPNRKTDTFGHTIRRMREKKLTFAEAITSEEFFIVYKSRLHRVPTDLFAQLEQMPWSPSGIASAAPHVESGGTQEVSVRESVCRR